ncbi:MAG TPA: hypothetical protein VHS99_18970 [Chloroflexota bacterium]|jgi:hypothetical protein|nr:hypothetical protein [Chloroflexota bacterium]
MSTPDHTLGLAEAAYAADADHLARELLVGLVFDEAVPLQDIYRAIERGLAGFAERRRRLRDVASSGHPLDHRLSP